MIAIANVKIWNIQVGVVLWDDLQNAAIFEFEEKFLDLDLDLSPITMSLAQIKSRKKVFSFPYLDFSTFNGLPGLLAQSIPQGFANDLITFSLENSIKQNLKHTPVDKLCYLFDRSLGALEFDAIENSPKEISESIKILDLLNFVNDAVYNKNNLKNYTKSFYQITTVISGSTPKAVVAYNPENNNFRSGTTYNYSGFDYWILKFHKNDNDESKVEFAYYLMAIDCGIKMSESKLLEENDQYYFMTKRFDRNGQDKIHLQSFSNLVHHDFITSEYPYEKVFEYLRQMKISYADLEQLYTRIVFNVMSKNCNDGTDKISFLMKPDGKWYLSPAYGLNYSNDKTAHKISINGKFIEITYDDLIVFAKNMNIKKPKKIIDRCNQVLFNWNDYAKTATINQDKIREIDRNLVIFENLN